MVSILEHHSVVNGYEPPGGIVKTIAYRRCVILLVSQWIGPDNIAVTLQLLKLEVNLRVVKETRQVIHENEIIKTTVQGRIGHIPPMLLELSHFDGNGWILELVHVGTLGDIDLNGNPRGKSSNILDQILRSVFIRAADDNTHGGCRHIQILRGLPNTLRQLLS